MTPTCVLDASALLALLQGEEGAAEVRQALRSRAAMSAVNLAEVLAKISDRGQDPAAVARLLDDRALFLEGIEVVPFDGDAARETARLRKATSGAGLSLGDRACLALAGFRDATALTSDRKWIHLRIGVRVRLIR